MKFNLKSVFSTTMLRLSIVSFSCFLYIHGAGNIESFASDAFYASHEKHKDVFTRLQEISSIEPKPLGGVSSARVGMFVSHLKDPKNHKLIAAIKYVYDLTSVIAECAKNLRAEEEANAQQGQETKPEEGISPESGQENNENQPAAALEDSQQGSQDQSEPKKETVSAAKAKFIAQAKEALMLVFEAHLMLYIALKGFLFEHRISFVRNQIASSLQSIVSNCISLRKEPVSVNLIKLNSFYHRALKGIVETNDTFKETFARECRLANKSGDFQKAAFLAMESRIFCVDVVHNPELKKVFDRTHVTRESLAQIFPEALTEARSLLEFF